MTSSLSSTRWFAWAAVFSAVQAAVVLGTSAAVGTLLDAATWWPSVGTATAIVMMSWSHAPAVAAGIVIAWLVSPTSVAAPLPDIALVLAQAVAMRMLVRRALGREVPRMDATGDVGVLISSSVMAALGINAAAGLLALLTGRGGLADLAEWLAATGSSGALGAYLIPSMTLALAARDESRVPTMKPRVVAAFVVLVLLAGTGFLTPWHWKGATGSLIVIAIPVVIWSAIRLGPRVTLILGIVLAIFATTGTMLGRGALAAPERTLLQRELISNLYVYMATALSLTILATIAERERALRREEETRRRLQDAAAALAESEARFRRIFESTVLGVFSWSGSGSITDANDAFLDMLGYSRADLDSGRLDWKLLTPPEYGELNELKHAEVRVVGHCAPFEKEYLRKDGGRITVLVASSLWAPGSDEGFATVVDITSQRQAEKALRSITHGTSALTGEAFFQQLVRELHEALGADHVLVATVEGSPPVRAHTIAFWSGNGYASPVSYDLAGTPCAVVTEGSLCYYGSGVTRLFPEDGMLEELGADCYLGVPLVGADGSSTGILAVLHGRPLDRPDWAQAVLNVFAARAAAEMQRLGAMNRLRASEEQLATVFDTVSDRLSLWSIDGDGRTRLVSVNRAGRTTLERHADGMWSDALIGGEIADVLGALFAGLAGASEAAIEEALDANRGSVRALLATGEPARHEEVVEHNGGTYAAEVEMIPVLADGGRITHILRSAKDISDRLRAEAARNANEARERQSQKLEAIGTLAGGIAHDFNNILTGIIGNAELARSDLPAGHEAVGRLDEVVRAVQRARNVVRQIVTFSRREDGTRQPLRLADVITGNFELLRASVPSSVGMAMSVEDGDAMVHADGGQLALVLMNLCSNAADAVRERGGQITISHDVVVVSEGHAALRHGVKPGEYARLLVEDDGSGMDEEVLRRIFDPYFTTKPAGEGTGLGLPVVHGIARAHGGAVMVHSTVDVGTRVEVLLPRIAPEAKPRVVAGGSERGNGEHVFLVDDETAIVDVGERLLKRLGYAVTAFLDPRQALAAFEADPDSVDIVVSDLTMPGLNGIHLARRIAEIRPDTPFILTTGFAAEHLEEVDGVRSIVEVLDKPFDRSTFARAVRAALDGEVTCPNA